MKNNRLIFLFVLSLMFQLSACEIVCDETESDEIGQEFFTVEYRDPSGANYLESVYDPNGIVVFLDTTGGVGGNPAFELISPGYEEGKFGPFLFTDRYIQKTNEAVNGTVLYGTPFSFDYFFKKDTYGQDTLRVDFLVSVDECRVFWEYIRYSLNGNPLPQYDNQRQAEIVIVE